MFVFFASFFRNISKTAQNILIKKIGQNHGIMVYKKPRISEHRKTYIFRDINYFVRQCALLNFCGRSNSKKKKLE